MTVFLIAAYIVVRIIVFITFVTATGERYCHDRDDAACGWQPRRTKNPDYHSLFAVALVTLDDEVRWGVVTIDCNLVGGFSDADRQVARHFAELASLGELIWRRKEAPHSGRTPESSNAS